MTQPLTGTTVLDVTHVMAGPFCTHVLKLLGARVIKVERPGEGDVMRYYSRDPAFAAMSPPFLAFNPGKESIAVDLKQAHGIEIVRRLAGRADVVVENFRPGVMARLGLGYEALSRANPKLVYCSVTGFGQDGPLRDHPAYDHIMQGVCGVMALTGAPGSGPTKVGFPMIDTFAGFSAAFATVAALLQRASTGRGQHVDVAMLDTALVLMVAMVAPYLTTGVPPEKVGNRGFNGSPTSDTFPTRDRPITLGANTQRQFESMCRVIGRPDLIADPRFPTPQAREQREEELRTEIEPALAKRSASEWETLLNDVGVPAGVVRSIPEIVEEPHLKHRRLLLDVEGPPRARTLNTGFQLEGGTTGTLPHAPRLGEHTDRILAELGYSSDDVRHLRREGVVA